MRPLEEKDIMLIQRLVFSDYSMALTTLLPVVSVMYTCCFVHGVLVLALYNEIYFLALYNESYFLLCIIHYSELPSHLS